MPPRPRGWLDLRIDDNNIYTVDNTPHSWLLPRVRAAIHHCGAGTTAAALRAGIPSIPIPTTLDQPFWAARLHRLGAATRPIPAARLTEARLTAAIREVIQSPHLTKRATEIRDHIRHEDSATAVAATLTAQRPRPSHTRGTRKE